MSRLKLAALLGSFTAALLLVLPASAQVWNETGAGDTLATAEIVTGAPGQSLTGIHGMLDSTLMVDMTPLYQVDLYRVYVSDFSSFSAKTVSSNFDDTALFLFDGAGFGVYTNDDNGIDLLSTLPAGGPQADGYYYLAVGLGGFSALDAFANSVFMTGSFTDVLAGAPGAGPLASWSQGFASYSESSMAYDIALTGVVLAPIPEPSTVALFVVGLVGVVAARRVKRQVAAT